MAISRYGCVWMPAVIRNPHLYRRTMCCKSSVIFLVLMVRANRWTRYVAAIWVLVWLQVKASNSVPDALVVDLLPAGLELEIRIWRTVAPAWSKVVAKCKTY